MRQNSIVLQITIDSRHFFDKYTIFGDETVQG